MGGIFISYRREDSRHITDRLADRLVKRFGRFSVFKDVDSIPLGSDFRKVLQEAIARCRVLLAVIGPRWLTTTDESGRRRVDSESDFVRIEIETALSLGLPIIPILVDNANIPLEGALPTSLQPLPSRHGMVLRPDPDFHSDSDRLIQSLEGYHVGEEVSRLKVLVLEESEFHRRSLELILRKEGHHAFLTDSADKALSAFTDEAFDLVLIQGQFGMDQAGQIAGQMRQLEQGRACHAVLLGMTGDPTAQELCLRAGMEGVVARPVQLQEFKAEVRRHIEIIDWVEALSRVSDDEELLRELIAVAQSEAPQMLQRIREALDQKAGPWLSTSAHVYAGIFSLYSVTEGFAVTRRIEQAGKRNDFQAAAQDLPLLERISARFLDRLARFSR